MASWTTRLEVVDERLFAAVVSRRTPWLDRMMRGITVLGDPPVIVLAMLLSVVVLKGPAVALARAGLLVLVLSHVAVQVLKRLAARPRPRFPVGVRSIIQAPDRFSFPSGHATAALAVVLPLVATLPPSVGAAVASLALIVGLSRCYLGVHYPGDVFMGWGIAVATWWVVGYLGWIP